MSAFRIFLVPAATAMILLAGRTSVPLQAQSPAGPANLPAPPEVVRIPNRPAPDKAPMPPEEILRRVAQTEDAVSLALGDFTYKKTVRLEELGPDGKASGRAEEVTQMTVESDGSRRPRPVGRTESTLQYGALEPDALEVIGRLPVFPFASSQMPKYDITYQTAEQVDDLMTYVFKVTPKQVSRTNAYFSGVIWVDDHDFAVVKTYGKWITETGDLTLPGLPFSLYETYRQYVANKYWMPAYTRSDGYPESGNASVSVRLTIRWEEFKPIHTTNSPDSAPPVAPTAQSPAAPAPAAPPPPADSDRPTLAPRQSR